MIGVGPTTLAAHVYIVVSSAVNMFGISVICFTFDQHMLAEYDRDFVFLISFSHGEISNKIKLGSTLELGTVVDDSCSIHYD